jgi:hypothetical protein
LNEVEYLRWVPINDCQIRLKIASIHRTQPGLTDEIHRPSWKRLFHSLSTLILVLIIVSNGSVEKWGRGDMTEKNQSKRAGMVLFFESSRPTYSSGESQSLAYSNPVA